MEFNLWAKTSRCYYCFGVVSPVGIGTSIAWENLVKGQSGITRITKFDPSAFSSQIAGEVVQTFKAEDYLSAKEARRMDTFIQYGLVAGTYF